MIVTYNTILYHMTPVWALREKERLKLEASITHKHKMGNEESTMCRYYMSC